MVLENQMQTMWNELGFCFVCGKKFTSFFFHVFDWHMKSDLLNKYNGHWA